jgi:hypothetical protein
MNLWIVTYRLNSWTNEDRVANVVAASAAKAIDGCNSAVWKSDRRRPYEITNVKQGIKIDQVQR